MRKRTRFDPLEPAPVRCSLARKLARGLAFASVADAPQNYQDKREAGILTSNGARRKEVHTAPRPTLILSPEERDRLRRAVDRERRA
jgi:hypothetical protein